LEEINWPKIAKLSKTAAAVLALIERAWIKLKTEMAEGESAAVIGSTRLPPSRVASPY
jgi:hypothetical protein